MARTARMIGVALPLALVLALAFGPKPASADASGLCRAFTMIAFAPTDVVLGPIIAAHDIHYGLTSQGDPVLHQTINEN